MTMEIQLLDTGGKFLCILNNEDALLGAYPVDDNMRLHVGTSLLYRFIQYLPKCKGRIPRGYSSKCYIVLMSTPYSFAYHFYRKAFIGKRCPSHIRN